MIASSCRKLFAAGILVAFACVPMEAVAAPLLSVTPPAADPAVNTLLLGEDKSDRMTVPVTIGGRGPYSFIVDTGSERTVISSELAEILDLDHGGVVKVHSLTGQGETPSVIIPSLRVSDIETQSIRAPTLARAHLGATGILGLDSLRSRQLLFDFRRGTISFARGVDARDRNDPDVIVVRARTKKGRMVLGDARINGRRVTVILDTGAQISIGNEALRRQLSTQPRTFHPVGKVDVFSVLGDRVNIDYAQVRRMEIGPLNIGNMLIAFSDLPAFDKFDVSDRPALLLGMDVMRMFERVSIDFENRILRFIPLDEDRGFSVRLT